MGDGAEIAVSNSEIIVQVFDLGLVRLFYHYGLYTQGPGVHRAPRSELRVSGGEGAAKRSGE